jgi:hypothetical protein
VVGLLSELVIVLEIGVTVFKASPVATLRPLVPLLAIWDPGVKGKKEGPAELTQEPERRDFALVAQQDRAAVF